MAYTMANMSSMEMMQREMHRQQAEAETQRRMAMMQQNALMQAQYDPYYGGLGQALAAGALNQSLASPQANVPKNVQPEPNKVLLLLEEDDATETV